MTEKRLTRVARKLRRERTEAENRLWSVVRNRQLDGEKFVFQFQIGPHVADFVCRSARLVVEVDGGQHADSASDMERTRLIEAHGYSVIRFWNNDVLANIEGVAEEISRALAVARNR